MSMFLFRERPRTPPAGAGGLRRPRLGAGTASTARRTVRRFLPGGMVEIVWGGEETCRSDASWSQVRRQVAAGGGGPGGGDAPGQELPPGGALHVGARVLALCPGWGRDWFPGVVRTTLPGGRVEVQRGEDGTVSSVSLDQVRFASA